MYPVAVGHPYAIAAGPDGAMWFATIESGTIGRLTTTVTPGISGFTPGSGAVGTAVTISGRNFAGVSQVTFNGVPASIVSHNAKQIVADVPAGATSGAISVTTAAGTATSSTPFTVT